MISLANPKVTVRHVYDRYVMYPVIYISGLSKTKQPAKMLDWADCKEDVFDCNLTL